MFNAKLGKASKSKHFPTFLPTNSSLTNHNIFLTNHSNTKKKVVEGGRIQNQMNYKAVGNLEKRYSSVIAHGVTSLLQLISHRIVCCF